MVSGETERWPHLEVPKFWSVQFGTEIKSVGVPSVADEVAIVQGSVDTRRFLAVYGYKGRIVAAVAFNQNTDGVPVSLVQPACGASYVAPPATGCNEAATWLFSKPINSKGAPLYGTEISWQQPFDFLHCIRLLFF
jgi:hypothetical protein